MAVFAGRCGLLFTVPYPHNPMSMQKGKPRKKGVRHPGIIGAVKGCRSEWKIVDCLWPFRPNRPFFLFHFSPRGEIKCHD